MIRNWSRLTCLLSLLLTLVSCGWQPRGQLLPPLALDSVAIVSEEQHTALLQGLKQAFLDLDTEVRLPEANPSYVLVLAPEAVSRRTVGLGNDSLAAAFELTLSQEYTWYQQGQAIAPPQEAIITRSLDASDPTGIDREQQLLLSEMRRDLVQQLLRQSYFLLQPTDQPQGN